MFRELGTVASRPGCRLASSRLQVATRAVDQRASGDCRKLTVHGGLHVRHGSHGARARRCHDFRARAGLRSPIAPCRSYGRAL